jgi:hypothetical protein
MSVGCRTWRLLGHNPIMGYEHSRDVQPSKRSKKPMDGTTDCPCGWLQVVALQCRWSERLNGVLQAFQVAMDNRACSCILRHREVRGKRFLTVLRQDAMVLRPRQTLGIWIERHGRV